MKTIKIGFSNFFTPFNVNDNFIVNILKERYDVQVTSDPDYLFCSCFGFEHVNFDGIKIFITGEDIDPDFNLYDYAIAFDDMKFGDRYLRFPLFAWLFSLKTAAKKHKFTDEDLAQKTGFCNFVYSNSMANKKRQDFFDLLSQYKKVDSGGKYLNNIGAPVANKYEFQKKYKFSIAFENDSSPGYTTEKIMDAFAAKTIPIYWGNPDISKDINPKSFINCHDYDSFEAVVERVKEIDNDPELYRSILSEPIFKEEKIPYEFTMDYLREFLFYIFDQPLETAGRRAKFSFRQNYSNTFKKMFSAYNKRYQNPIFGKIYGILGAVHGKLIKK
ncbi:MAG: hypothetical protein K5756_09710 [Clostridiales bacterium]|nr:hypothetical protein [Clostridiales bacterium]